LSFSRIQGNYYFTYRSKSPAKFVSIITKRQNIGRPSTPSELSSEILDARIVGQNNVDAISATPAQGIQSIEGFLKFF